ncbi:MAG: TIGR00730 family Rossman fold protein [bacterium]
MSNAPKAYNNLEFLNSPDARVIRLISEFLEPHRRFRKHRVNGTIVFFGSARIKSKVEARNSLNNLKLRSLNNKISPAGLKLKLSQGKTDFQMSQYYEDAVKLAKYITEWSNGLSEPNRFVVCSGGGPGIMEAANKGAIAGKGRSIGLNISLPFEQGANKFITKDMNFEFHYFFMRKFWFVYLSKALVMFPGGFGTFDELFEVLTLLQTKKIKKKVTVVLYGEEYWKKIINFDAMVKLGVISKKDMKLFKFASSPEEAFEHLKMELKKNYPALTK